MMSTPPPPFYNKNDFEKRTIFKPKLILDMWRKHTFYIALPYHGRELWSFQYSCKAMFLLRKWKLNVFSPIAHTHNFHEYMQGLNHNTSEEMDRLMCYYEWDISIIESLKNPVVLMSREAFDGTNWLSTGCKMEYEFAISKNIPVFYLEDFMNGILAKLST